ncbi:MAG: hypothetical protein LC745_00730 [Planctomycetia bacterium]|nr:hypothetical protein [Planctomycetia bacterium]
MARGDGRSPDPAAGRGIHDREFDLPGQGPRPPRNYAPHQDDQRLLANPFLAVLGMIAWYEAIRRVVQARRLDLFFPVLASLVMVIYLFQFHCLDCGATDRLSRWRDHACGPVRLRANAGFSRPVHAMTPVSQTVLWFYVLAVSTVVAYIVTR